MVPSDELLRRGIEAAKAGQVVKAHRLLQQVVEREPQNEKAWLWLSGVVETDDQRSVCLQNVLAINPHNQAAQRGLTALRQKAVAVKPLPEKLVPQPPSKKKWYRQAWFLWLTFLICTPLWAVIVLSDRNQSTGVKILAGILLVVSIIFICPSLARELLLLISSLPTPTTYEVTYRLTGSAQSVSAIYWTADGMEQRTVDLPWTKTFQAQERQLISILAQNEGDSGSIKCQILINGKLTKTATSEGPYAGVTCGP